MPRHPSFHATSLFAALILAAGGLTAAPAAAQSAPARPATERYDDPVGNGIAIGAALGAIGGVVLTGALYAQCDDSCDAPAKAPTYAMYAGFGAGIGVGAGWVIDKLHKGKRPAAVPVAVAIRADRQERAVRLQWRF
jgi:MFS family permease